MVNIHGHPLDLEFFRTNIRELKVYVNFTLILHTYIGNTYIGIYIYIYIFIYSYFLPLPGKIPADAPVNIAVMTVTYELPSYPVMGTGIFASTCNRETKLLNIALEEIMSFKLGQ